MPNCFQLTRIGENEPTSLGTVDEHICQHFGAEVDTLHWYKGWYDIIGFGLACGQSFDDFIDDDGYSESIREIARFLKDNYTSDAWAEVGR